MIPSVYTGREHVTPVLRLKAAAFNSCRGTSAGSDVSVERRLRCPDSGWGLEVVAAGPRVGWEAAVIPMRRQREPPQEESVPRLKRATAGKQQMTR